MAHHWYAEYLSAMGRHAQAFAEIRRAQELDPVEPLLLAVGGEIYAHARRYDQVIEQCRRGLKLDSNFGLAHVNLAWGYIGRGMYNEARQEFEKGAAIYGSDFSVGLPVVYAATGKKAEALKFLDQARVRSRNGETLQRALARAYMYLGDKQSALQWLEKGYENREPNMVFIRVDSAFDPLRSDPRFQALLRRMNFPP